MTKISYKVYLYIKQVDVNGAIRESESSDFEFTSGDFINDRKKAIKKAKELYHEIDYRLPEGETFSSPWEAERLNYRGFNCFSISIYLVDDLGEIPIYGDEEYPYEFLECEAQLFKKEYPEMKFTLVKNEEDEEVEVIEEDLAFILRHHLYNN